MKKIDKRRECEISIYSRDTKAMAEAIYSLNYIERGDLSIAPRLARLLKCSFLVFSSPPGDNVASGSRYERRGIYQG